MKMDLEGAELLALQGALAVPPGIEAIVYEQLESGDAGELVVAEGYRLEDLAPRTILAPRI